MNPNRKADYDPFADLYNIHWGNSADRFYGILSRILGDRLQENSNVLDLCCGTGQLAALLTQEGHDVTGIDCSSGMLDHAKLNSPDSTFLLKDARDFQFSEQFDLVVSTYDSLNHILKPKELQDVFRNVYDSLKKEGAFLFDVNLEPAYVKNWNGSFNIVEEDHVCAVKTRYHQEKKTAEFNVTHFSKEGEHWSRNDFQLIQRCYEPQEFVDCLKDTGFASVEIFSVEENGHHRLLEDTDERAFFLALKS